ncbi:MAG: hypothetical protein KAG66_00365 [Methylococcales bacterium]|nr:hypothetical protein [Methylococcales bacterium]
MTELMEKPDDRKIVWYCDQTGGCGKTWLTRACFSKFESIRFENSKSSDIKHAYNGERIVFFDLTRSQQEHFNYEAMETIKNGIMFSSNYDSAMKIFDHPHVVIMANWLPDTSKLSQDRWCIRHINHADLECHLVNRCGTTEKGGGFHKAEACVKAAHLMAEGLDIEDLAEDHIREYEAMVSHCHIIEKHASCLRRRKAKAKGANKYCKQPLRSWQHKLMTELMQEPDDRKIIWYCDQTGSCGKTWLTRACFSKFESICFENSKSSDIKHAYNGERIVFFNLTRSQQEHFNYEAMETIKNGIMFSSKYDSAMKIYDHPHMVVMANWLPDTSKLSTDRWSVRKIKIIIDTQHSIDM